jgi:hypothetical protein
MNIHWASLCAMDQPQFARWRSRSRSDEKMRPWRHGFKFFEVLYELGAMVDVLKLPFPGSSSNYGTPRPERSHRWEAFAHPSVTHACTTRRASVVVLKACAMEQHQSRVQRQDRWCPNNPTKKHGLIWCRRRRKRRHIEIIAPRFEDTTGSFFRTRGNEKRG